MRSISDIAGTALQPKTRLERCDAHGEFEAKCFIRSIWSSCPTCSAEATAREKILLEAKLRDDRRQAWLRRLHDAGIPKRFQDRSLQSFVAKTEDQTKALNFAEEYADKFDDVYATGRCALLAGTPGTGKTHLAVGIAMEIMQRDQRTVLFSTVMAAMRRIKNTWGGQGKESEMQAISAFVLPDLLILDEVGVQFGSAFEKLILFDIINNRYQMRRPTIFLSNLTLDEVKESLGERIYDRMREDGGQYIVFDWESWRGQNTTNV